MPKEKKNEDQSKTTTETIDQIREQIAVADTLFSSIAGLKRERGLGAWLRGRNDHISFEIVTAFNQISFYVAVPDKLKKTSTS